MRADYATRPREQIVAVLQAERRFLSAAEIARALDERHAKVSLSTVYRTLERLSAKGDATERVDEAGEATYMLCEPTHHHHAICSSCGRVEDVDCSAINQFSESLRKIHGFELEHHKMEFLGKCRDCR